MTIIEKLGISDERCAVIRNFVSKLFDQPKVDVCRDMTMIMEAFKDPAELAWATFVYSGFIHSPEGLGGRGDK